MCVLERGEIRVKRMKLLAERLFNKLGVGLHESKSIQYLCNYCLALVNY